MKTVYKQIASSDSYDIISSAVNQLGKLNGAVNGVRNKAVVSKRCKVAMREAIDSIIKAEQKLRETLDELDNLDK